VKVTQESLNQVTYEPVSGSVQVPGTTVEHGQGRHHRHSRRERRREWPGGGDRDLQFSDAPGTIDPSSVETG